MIDTVKIISPEIDEDTAVYIERQLLRRFAVRADSGEVAYDITADSLSGTYDHKIQVRVMREKLVNIGLVKRDAYYVQGITEDQPAWVVARKADTENLWALRPCPPYLIVEGSIHKHLLGHNISGGPCEVLPAVRWFVDYLGSKLDPIFGLELPDGGDWEIQRIDWAETYDIGFVAVQEYISSISACRFPRRDNIVYPGESVFIPGETTALKFYAKGPEFAAHDSKVFRKSPLFENRWDELERLQSWANGILRVETSIKKHLIRQTYPDGLKARDCTSAWLEQVHDREVTRFLKDGKMDSVQYRNQNEVRERLVGYYGSKEGMALFGTWSTLAVEGEARAKSILSKSAYYRHLAKIREAGCHWSGSDLVLRHSALPPGFTVSRSESTRSVGEAFDVVSQLAPYRLAA